jgi:hypothetical protein
MPLGILNTPHGPIMLHPQSDGIRRQSRTLHPTLPSLSLKINHRKVTSGIAQLQHSNLPRLSLWPSDT